MRTNPMTADEIQDKALSIINMTHSWGWLVSVRCLRLALSDLIQQSERWQAKFWKADREITKIENEVVMWDEFDADGPGDCGDRLLAAIKTIKADRDRLKEKLNGA